ncbi:hypothetical protein H7904_11325 [Staphylococcus capitis]|jgi:Co/Zn/Cd efflux system component|uniref:hypothetical protein n=1 Tax=Staphylococcus TaxID=1279 RepID=UPI00066C1D00|nr:hypothetical protein [Staphylococcus capitis]MBC3081243.1 hypothetical protein [Staphylococcus capitis]MDS3979670.1 hypothetical protein [Staphylococcus capitis]MDS3986485.1 hypothetical protein [Staphylococcus capitis]MDS3990962.1 hypothetical protein [Staphylococcus capitis]MDS4018852.1 hypothetical protein [Staphylococcus capitis]
MKQHLFYAFLFAVVVFLGDTFKHLLIYFSGLHISFTDSSALDIFISVIFGFLFGLFISWALDLPKKKK